MENRKLTLPALSQFVHHHLLWFLIGAYVMAAVFPTAGLWIKNVSFSDISIFQTNIHGSLLLLLLAMLMFNAGLGVKTSHLKTLVQRAWVLVAGLTANLLIPIVYIFFITLLLQLWHNPEETQHILVGLALVAAMADRRRVHRLGAKLQRKFGAESRIGSLLDHPESYYDAHGFLCLWRDGDGGI